MSRLLTAAAEREGCMGPGWPLPASAWLTLGAAGVRPVLRRPRRAGTSIVAVAEAGRSAAAGESLSGFVSWGAGSRCPHSCAAWWSDGRTAQGKGG